ncbi:MAG: hypothetical protein HQ557_02210 [Bacteroidetes bacterium]|nr:hypothetical protein [Bacteroidota bacterium]
MISTKFLLIIDIGLFLITIFIIIFYRQLDKKDRQIHLVKTLMENMQVELDEKFKKMRTTVESMEDSVQGHEITVNTLLKKVNGSLSELDRHADDLQKLQSYTSHYHRILNELSTLTQKAEKRLQKLKAETETIEEMEKKVEAFTRETAALEERIILLDGEVSEQVEKSRVECIDSFTREVGEKLEAADFRILTATENAVEIITSKAEAVELQKTATPEPELEPEPEPKPELKPKPKPEPEPVFDDDEEEDDIVEEINFEDDDEDFFLEDEPEEVEQKLTKRDIVEGYGKEGLDTARISELSGIPRGEVELILELIDFTES